MVLLIDMFAKLKINSVTALLFWSALFIYSCGDGKKSNVDHPDRPTMTSDNLTITNYENGRMIYRFETPHMMRFENKDSAWMIFDKGVYIVTFDDSTNEIKSWLTAKYAIYYETRDQWEARDSVVAHDRSGKVLYTNLLYWDHSQRRITSPIETKVIDGEESVIGLEGFQSDEELNNIEFFNSKGRILVDTATNVPVPADSTVVQ
ncbi:MAG: LPS export ABC transporter periplasmic protein LptC [Rikenellaceae bacterium]